MGAIPSFIRRGLKDLFDTLKGRGKASLVILGLDSAGKTTLVNLFKGAESGAEFKKNTQPTIGFSLEEITFGNTNIQIWDIGGQRNVMSFWHQYVSGVDGLVFMIDVVDIDRFQASFEAFMTLVPYLRDGLPILLFLNKRDTYKNDPSELKKRREMVEKLYKVDDKSGTSESYMKHEDKVFKVRVSDVSVLDDIAAMESNAALSTSSVYGGFKWLIEEIKSRVVHK